MGLELDVQYAATEGSAELPAEEQFEAWVGAALAGRKDDAQVVVRIVDSAESRQLNEDYRHGSGPTNILSFPFEKPELLTPPLLGDLVICAPLVRQEAREQHCEEAAHWAHLVVHGVLHLLGYDHEDARQAGIMEGIEKEVLARLGFPNPYAGEDWPEEADGGR